MSGGGGGGAGGGDDKNSMHILWMVGFIFVIGFVIWWQLQDQLKFLFIKIKWLELEAIYFVVQFLPDYQFKLEIAEALGIARIITPESLNSQYAAELASVSGKYLRYPIIIFLGVCAYYMYGKNVKNKYRKRYDMQALATQERSEWPQINAVHGLDLVNTDINEGPWAMAQTPVEFCKKNGILAIAVEKRDPGVLYSEDKFKMVLDHTKADAIFTKQLGRMWNGPEAMPIHRRALFAAFIARGCKDTKSAQNLIRQINESCSSKNPGRLNFDGADALWKKHYKSKEVQELVSKHGYEFTIFTAAFLFAREDGVFPTSDFMWLKPIDRRFWYVLNSVGRQTPPVESAGVHAHFLAEKALGRALGMPMIKEATKALQLALDDIIYSPSAEEKAELLKQAEELETKRR